MKNLATQLVFMFIAPCLVAGGLYSQEEVEQRVTVGERAVDPQEKWLEKTLQVKAEMQIVESGQEADYDRSEVAPREYIELAIAQDSGVKNGTELVKKAIDQSSSLAYTTHIGALHRPIAVSIFGDKVELEDGSIYTVRPKDRLKTLDWMTSDTILVVPPSFFSSYQYALVNQSTGVRVEVNLTLGPIYNGQNSHWIIAIDRELGKICLEDGSIWEIFCLDLGASKRWLIGDTVIIGVNDGWFKGAKPNIFVNVNLNEYIKTKCVF